METSTPTGQFRIAAAICVLLLSPLPGRAQVFVVQPEHVEKRYSEITPTSVRLTRQPLNDLGHEQLIRFLQQEQGFAMRPLPVAVLTLHANGPMAPSGQKYIDLLHQKGASAKPGERVVITDIKVHKDDIVLDLNGGPFHRHRFLRHLSVGMGAADMPLANDYGTVPAGTRIVLQFPSRVPSLSGEQVEALLKPLIDFGARSPAEAYAETLPTFLRRAIDEHRILIGMDRDMVLYAKGEPIRKIREEENGKQVVTWMYGESPQPVEFVRFSGSFVVRDEVARVGEPTLVRTANEMHDYWGQQPVAAASQHEVQLGDRTAASIAQQDAPRAAPTLRNPGEKLPGDQNKGSMQPVHFPKDQQRPGDPGLSQTPPAGTSPSATGTSAQQTTNAQH